MEKLRILLIAEDDGYAEVLDQELRNAGCNQVERSSETKELHTRVAGIKPDAVIIGLESPGQHILESIRAINRDWPVPVILFADDTDSMTIQCVIQAGASAYVVDGLQTSRINAVVEVAIARFHEQQSLRNELEKTKAKLAERTLVDRAKWILIKQKAFSEEEAYHTLRKLAMDKNVRISEMAKNVIAVAELLET